MHTPRVLLGFRTALPLAQARLELVQALQGSPAAKQVAVLFDLWAGDAQSIGTQGGWLGPP
jgi:hypothetical protein